MSYPEQTWGGSSFQGAPPSYNQPIYPPFNQSLPQGGAQVYSAPPNPVPRKFPEAFNLYRHSTWHSTFTLGEHENQPLYMFASHSGLSSSPSVVLHSGPDTSFPPLASAERRSFSNSFDVNLPPAPGFSAREEVKSSHHAFGVSSYQFSIEVGPNNQRETFEWRHSRSDVVKSLDGEWAGWKLVRMAPSAGRVSTSTYTDEGHEVVAAWAMAGTSMTKVAKFHFTGTGASGQLGERWAVMAVVTACALYQKVRRQRNAGNLSTAAAS